MPHTKNRVVIWDDIVMMILALVSAYLLVVELTTTLPASQTEWYRRIDIAVALIFLAEFCIKFFMAESKARFFRSNWWYLLASIPVTTPATQALRLLRLTRLIRFTEGTHAFAAYFERFVKRTHLVAIFVIWIILVFSGTIAFFSFEHEFNSHVTTLFDSLWWVMSTITTVGYGDIVPMTIAGRIVGICLMITGIGTTGIFTALVATFLIKDRVSRR